jgi:hypothetical protein
MGLSRSPNVSTSSGPDSARPEAWCFPPRDRSHSGTGRGEASRARFHVFAANAGLERHKMLDFSLRKRWDDSSSHEVIPVLEFGFGPRLDNRRNGTRAETWKFT